MTLGKIHKIATTASAVVVATGGIITAVTWINVWIEDLKAMIACELETNVDILNSKLRVANLRTQYAQTMTNIATHRLDLLDTYKGILDIEFARHAISESESQLLTLIVDIKEAEVSVEDSMTDLEKCE